MLDSHSTDRWWRQGIAGEGWRHGALTVALLAVWYATSLLYPVLNHGPHRIFLRTRLDELLPVVPALVIPYVSATPFIAASMMVFLGARVRVFRSAAAAMIIAWAISYTLYFFLQSYIERPQITGTDLTSRMVQTVYATDNPYNAFPSLHVSLSTILAMHWRRVDRRIGAVVAIWVALIIASTVLIRQHYLADVIAGLVVAVTATRLAWRWFGAEPIRAR